MACHTDAIFSIVMGKPFAIADRDIDVPLPSDIDESCEDVEALAKAAASTGIQTPNSPISTSMTGFIYLCQLRKLESSIQQAVYRVDDSEETTEAEIEQFLLRLQDWKSK
ncbi:hypothetical protein KJ359_006909 [Pestalotiopsis sp. 9143b]|nr:hypothetical protein KJ359_006909 [Pestalotiopsis sp. 9143b]